MLFLNIDKDMELGKIKMSKKAKNTLMIIYIIALFIMISGATFAYFDYIKVSRISPKVEVGSAVTQFITFDVGKPIRITPNTINFAEGMGNLEDETFASAYLRLGSGEDSAQFFYNLFLQIDKNNLTYSTKSKSPELLLQIIDHDGKELTYINGLEYVTVNGISGFDITVAKGRYYITYNFPISTINEKTHLWKAKFIFVNLEESQDGNLEKELEGFIQIESAEGNE